MNRFKQYEQKRTRLAGLMLVFAMLNIFIWLPAQAATNVGVGNGTPASCTEAALNAALAAGGEITFNCGNANHTINFTNIKNISSDITIDGGGKITLSGNNATRLFSIIAENTFTLRNISIVNAPDTAAIFNAGTLVVENVTFRNNLRGAIYNAGGHVSINDSRFEENQRSAVTNENGGTLSVANSTFLNNTIPLVNTGNGGGVYNPNGHATITHSHFEGNQATDSGGAIYNSGVITIEHTTVINNSAYGGGGIANADVMVIRNSHISGNRATGVSGAGGGVLHYNQSATPSSLVIVQSTIDRNSSVVQGGGLWVSGTQATFDMTNSTVYSNTASDTGGGGLYVTSAKATLTNVTFSDNVAETSDGDNIENSNILPGTITLRNTIVNGGGCEGGVVDGDGNLEFPGTSCGFDTASADPGLGALTNNGGWTPTLAITEGGPAQNTGVNANCPATDQRGVLRAQFVTCDIGAFEWGALPILESIEPQSTLALSPTFTLVVNGSNFIPGLVPTRVLWNGDSLPTTFVNSTELHAVVAASRIVAGGVVSITVETPVIDGGVSEHTELFTIIKRDQTIDFDELEDRTLDPLTFKLDVEASSGLPVTFTATGVCAVEGNTVTLNGELGACTITAQQAGNESYNPAPDVVRSFNVINPVLMRIPQVFGPNPADLE